MVNFIVLSSLSFLFPSLIVAIEREIFRHLSRRGETAGIFNSQAEFSIATNQRDLSAALTLPEFDGKFKQVKPTDHRLTFRLYSLSQ